MKKLHLISRFIVGAVFIFSGFVKGLDPLGTAYRIEDYFIAWNVMHFIPLALPLSVLLSTMEFVLGVVVLLNIKPRLGYWILLLVMSFFTVLTFFDALYNPVPDCGCFGDALKLTNWQTFYKNVGLMFFTLVLFLMRNKTSERFNNRWSYSIAAFTTAIFISFSVYCYRHLPVIDFMPWKIGNKVYVENPMPVKYYLTYRNKTSGETMEYLSPNYPYNDSVWMSQWEFVNQRVEDPNKTNGIDIQIIDSTGNDFTESILRNPENQFILVAWDIEKANAEAMQQMNTIADSSLAAGYGFVCLTSSLPETIEKVRKSLGLTYEIMMADDVALKVMVRANPGLLKLKNGVVKGKWHFHDFTDWENLKRSGLN